MFGIRFVALSWTLSNRELFNGIMDWVSVSFVLVPSDAVSGTTTAERRLVNRVRVVICDPE